MSVEGGSMEKKKSTLGNRKVGVSMSLEVEEGTPGRIPGGDEVIEPTPDVLLID